ncbi:MAG: TRIC cation channel family protein, partial [Candidatus Eremiobacteraeota bacterium]|nr:TRIC cation channel family protein [Candidatus Eremiobacteraeota bacterium]
VVPLIEQHLQEIQRQTFILPAYFDYSATFLWAITGALLGARRGYAILGIATVALVSSTGGGLLRDGIFLQKIPMLVRTPVYLYLIVAAVLLVMLFGPRVQRIPQLNAIVGLIDAAGLGAYAVVGMNLALAAHMSLIGVGVVGMVNAVGGGILRDVLNREEPHMFKPGTIEESAALVGCVAFIALISFTSLGQFISAWATIGVVFAVRLIAVRFHVETKPLIAFQEYWKSE